MATTVKTMVITTAITMAAATPALVLNQAASFAVAGDMTCLSMTCRGFPITLPHP
jgi:hypothetical protein